MALRGRTPVYTYDKVYNKIMIVIKWVTEKNTFVVLEVYFRNMLSGTASDQVLKIQKEDFSDFKLWQSVQSNKVKCLHIPQ